MITNPYKVLGVPDGASEEECTKAYKRLAILFFGIDGLRV